MGTVVTKCLLEMVTACRLLRAGGMTLGISTRIAIALVHLGIDLSGIATRPTLAGGLELAFAQLGLEVISR
jgi:rsbT co-antagonist protein RsbR